MGELRVLVRALLEELAILIYLSVILFIVSSLSFLQVLAVSHFDCSLALSFGHTIVENESVLVLDGELIQLLIDQGLNLLENFDIVLGNKRDGFAHPASTSRAANTMYVVLRVGRDIEIDDNVDVGDVEATRCHICRDQNVSVVCLETIECVQTLLLR